MPIPPILRDKEPLTHSVFTPHNLLREARRQKSLAEGPIPPICVLDPDGDILDWLRHTGLAQPIPHWPCYHTTLYGCVYDGLNFGLIGRAVGASFAVLLAEELFAAGCELLISITSSGQITALGESPYFVLIDRAWRDEGTSYHYLDPSDYAALNGDLLQRLDGAYQALAVPVYQGATWTTDAPFRETAQAIEQNRQRGILAVEMEAAALYAFAQARQRAVVCFAHVTNQMAQIDGDFEKGEAGGSLDALQVICATARRLMA